MSETWTEYGVVCTCSTGQPVKCPDRKTAQSVYDRYPLDSVIVGRKVTASDWLPVQTWDGVA